MAWYYSNEQLARYRDDHGGGSDRRPYSVGRKTGSGSGTIVGADSKAAARRWTELKARIRVARALRHTSQNRLPPTRQTACNNEVRRTWTTSRLQEPTKNRQTTGQPLRTTRQSEVMSTQRTTSGQARYTRTAWWKCSDSEDRHNRNDPATLDTDKMAPVNRQHNSHHDHVVDNFRFIDANRKWTQNEPRYVDGNMTRLVRNCRRAKSLDEESDNDNAEDGDIHSFNNSINRSSPTVNFGCATYECSEEIARTDHLRCDDVEQSISSTSKRSRSRWTSEPLFTGRSVDQQRAIDDLLSLDQSMDVDSDHDEGQAVHHSCDSEFLYINDELQHLCLSYDDPKTAADLKLTTTPSSGVAVSSPPRLPVMMFSTVENETCDRNYSIISSEVADKPLTNDSRTVCPDYKGHAQLTVPYSNAIDRTVGMDRNNRYYNSYSVSHPESAPRQNVDGHRLNVDEAGRSKFDLPLTVRSHPSRNGSTLGTPSADLCTFKPEFTSNSVSFTCYISL